MSQKEDVSAMMDGELEAEEIQFLLKNLNREGLEAWQNFSLVSDALQASDVATLHNPKLLENIARALEAEPTIVSNQLRTQINRQKFWSGLTSINSKRIAAMAAGISFCALMLQVFVPPSSPDMLLAKDTTFPAHQEVVLDESSLSYWQEYLLAHHQLSPGVGASAVVSMVRSDVPVYEASVAASGSQQVQTSQLRSDLQWMNLWDGHQQTELAPSGTALPQDLSSKAEIQAKQYPGF